MYWSILSLFFAVVTAIIGFLGIGFGPIQLAQIIFYVSLVVLIVCFILELPRKNRKPPIL